MLCNAVGGYKAAMKSKDIFEAEYTDLEPEEGSKLVYTGITRKERLHEFLSQSDCLEIMCVHVANGGSLTQMAKDMGFRYTDLLSWIRGNSKRSETYDQALEDRKEWSREKFLQALHEVAHSDIRDLYNSDGSMKPPSEWPDSIARAISSVKVTELFEGVGSERNHVGYTKEVKLWDKLKALDILGKSLKEYESDKNINVNLTLEKLVGGSWDKQGQGDGEKD